MEPHQSFNERQFENPSSVAAENSFRMLLHAWELAIVAISVPYWQLCSTVSFGLRDGVTFDSKNSLLWYCFPRFQTAAETPASSEYRPRSMSLQSSSSNSAAATAAPTEILKPITMPKKIEF
jgi:hypothetical protein